MTGNLAVPNLSIASTNWLGFGDYGERISGSNGNSSLTFSTDATLALTLDSSQNATFAGGITATYANLSSAVNALYFRTAAANTDYNLITRNNTGNALFIQSAQSNTNQPIANFRYGSATVNQGTPVLQVSKDNSHFVNCNVGIGTASPITALHVEDDNANSWSATTDWTVQASDSLALVNTSNNDGDQITSLYMRASGSGGNVSARQVLRNTSSGSGEIHWQMRDAAHTSTTNDKMILKSSGELGIGISPQAKLHVDGHIYVNTGNAIYADFFRPYAGTLATYGSNTNTEHYFLGNVGIGTSSPIAPLDVVRGGTTGLTSVNARTALLVQNNLSNGTVLSINAKNTGYSGIFLGDQDSEAICQIQYNHVDDKLKFLTNGGGYNPLTLSGQNVGIGNSDPNKPLTITSDSGANTLGLRARSADDYSFIQFFNHAGTALRGQIYSKAAGDIGFTTGTDSSAGNDLYIKNGTGVGIGTASPAGLLHIFHGSSGSSVAADGADQVVIENNDSVLIDIKTPAGNTGGIIFSDPDGRGKGQVTYSHSTDDMNITAADNINLSADILKYSNVAGDGYFNMTGSSSRYADSGFWVANNYQLEVGNADIYIKTQQARSISFGTTNQSRMRIDPDGHTSIGLTDGLGSRLAVQGSLRLLGGHADLASITTAVGSVVASGSITHTIGYSGTYVAGKTWTWTYAAASWKSFHVTLRVSGTAGFSTYEGGGYNNNGGPMDTVEHGNDLGSFEVTRNGQNMIMTYTAGTTTIHPFFELTYRQSGGDGSPYMDRLSLVQA
jgi:hypothetical protein